MGTTSMLLQGLEFKKKTFSVCYHDKGSIGGAGLSKEDQLVPNFADIYVCLELSIFIVFGGCVYV